MLEPCQVLSSLGLWANCISHKPTQQTFAGVKSLLYYFCSNFMISWFIPPLFIERIKQFQYCYKFSALIEGFHQATSICSFSQDGNKIIFCLQEVALEGRKALHEFEVHCDYSVCQKVAFCFRH